mgnify:FL=1
MVSVVDTTIGLTDKMVDLVLALQSAWDNSVGSAVDFITNDATDFDNATLTPAEIEQRAREEFSRSRRNAPDTYRPGDTNVPLPPDVLPVSDVTPVIIKPGGRYLYNDKIYVLVKQTTLLSRNKGNNGNISKNERRILNNLKKQFKRK